jgi:glycine cleavage system aminomethyltransferase T
MGYVQTPYAQDGTAINVKIRDKTVRGRISAFPLYDADKYGSKRKI